MSVVRTFEDFVPAPRQDGVSWTEVRIEEAIARTGPWTTIDVLPLYPPDADPAQPATRAFTTSNATLEGRWFRITFLDAQGGEGPIDPVGPGRGVASTTYATREDLAAYLAEDGQPAGRLPERDASDRLLARAERDIDRAIGGPPHPDRARRLDPLALTDAQAEALTRATCAQASFLIEQRPRSLVGADGGLTRAGDLTFAERPLPRLGARVVEELAGFGLLARTGTAAPSPVPPPIER